MGLYTIICPIGVETLQPQAVFRTRQTSGFFMSKICRSFFQPLKNDLETQCREGGEYNTRKGNNPDRTCGGFRTSWHPIFIGN